MSGGAVQNAVGFAVLGLFERQNERRCRSKRRSTNTSGGIPGGAWIFAWFFHGSRSKYGYSRIECRIPHATASLKHKRIPTKTAGLKFSPAAMVVSVIMILNQ